MGRRAWIIAAAAVAFVVVVAAGGFVWWFQRGEAPAAVNLASVVAQIEAAESVSDDSGETPAANTAPPTAAPAATTAPTDPLDDNTRDVPTTTPAPPTAAPAATTAPTDPADDDGEDSDVSSGDGDGDEGAPTTTIDEDAPTAAAEPSTKTAPADQTIDPLGHLSGTWTVQAAEDGVDLLDGPAVSFAGYRVDEVLAGGLGENTAVGRTADVTGSIELRGDALVEARVQVIMATLRTDDSHRDSHARGSLNTKEFPQAKFTLIEPIELPAGLADGEAFSGTAEGALTIKGVTKRAAFDLQAQLVGDRIVAVGSSAVLFSDYGVDTPTSISVISVEDHGIMEFQLIFIR